jgi:hypothetical protein
MADKLSVADLKLVAEYIKDEKERRKSKRRHLDAHWKEIDRQLDMEPVEREVSSGEARDWYPNIEEPLQANTLEVVLADVRKLVFPKSSEWYTVTVDMSNEYMDRWEARRQRKPLIGIEPEDIDQKGADALVKGTLDYIHRLYNFREHFMLMVAEAIKYGTSITRVKPVKLAKFAHIYRGIQSDTLIAPALVPTSIKNVFLDDYEHSVMHEGIMTAPMTIRCGGQLLEDLKRTAKVGGPERGWISKTINKMEHLGSQDKDRRGVIEIIEAEGDFVVPRSRGSIYLPNSIITIAVGSNGAETVRYRTNSQKFPSYVCSHYMRESITSAYGVSPLMKGQPIQEVASLMLNDLAAAGSLNAKPPVAYDRNDAAFAASGGPEIYPGAKWKTDAPDQVVIQKMASINDLVTAYLAMNEKYDDLTGVNEPRTGGRARSHTSATSADIEATRGMARTADFADDLADGALPTILSMEYAIMKAETKGEISIPMDTAGIPGWLKIAMPDLADLVQFNVAGAQGVMQERERVQNFIAAAQFALQTAGFAAQLGKPIDIDFENIIAEGFNNAGIQNVSRFIRATEAAPPGATQQPELQDSDGSGAADPLAALQAFGEVAA